MVYVISIFYNDMDGDVNSIWLRVKGVESLNNS